MRRAVGHGRMRRPVDQRGLDVLRLVRVRLEEVQPPCSDASFLPASRVAGGRCGAASVTRRGRFRSSACVSGPPTSAGGMRSPKPGASISPTASMLRAPDRDPLSRTLHVASRYTFAKRASIGDAGRFAAISGTHRRCHAGAGRGRGRLRSPLVRARIDSTAFRRKAAAVAMASTPSRGPSNQKSRGA